MTITSARVRRTITPKIKSQQPAEDGVLDFNYVTLALRRILANAKEELELIREMKAAAVSYRQAALKNGDSESRRLTLNARVMKHREIEDAIRQASGEMQKILADIRITRIAIQEELAKHSNVAEADKLNSIVTSIKETFQKPAVHNIEKKLETVKY
jgi:hypothetical protein